MHAIVINFFGARCDYLLFARCSATENAGTINDEIEWDNKQCLQNKFFYVMIDLISSSCAPNNVIIIEKLNKYPMILFS